MCLVLYLFYIRKERFYEDVKDLYIDSGIYNFFFGIDFFV